MQKFVNQIKNRINLFKHLKTAIFVGAILNVINQANAVIDLEFDKLNYFKLVLTFFVPFAVSVYSAATSKNLKSANDKSSNI